MFYICIKDDQLSCVGKRFTALAACLLLSCKLLAGSPATLGPIANARIDHQLVENVEYRVVGWVIAESGGKTYGGINVELVGRPDRNVQDVLFFSDGNTLKRLCIKGLKICVTGIVSKQINNGVTGRTVDVTMFTVVNPKAT